MQKLMLCTALALWAAPASADLVRTLDQDPQSGAWEMQVPGWSAKLTATNPDDMAATVELTPEGGTAISAKVDMLSQNLPLLMNIEETQVCEGAPLIVVSVSDPPAEEDASFTYRRWLFQPEGGKYLGEFVDQPSTEAGGLLPAAVVADDMTKLCK